jgi:predicted CoA-binding protein
VPSVDQAIADFLAQKRIAVVGVSREPGGKHGGNVVYQRLKSRGYEVFAVNPNTETVEGDPCYRDLASIPGGVDAVVIATTPAVAPTIARECRELGITRVWMHRSLGGGSVSPEAHAYCRANGIASIAGGCPLMYGPTSDGAHRFMRSIVGLLGKLPKEA